MKCVLRVMTLWLEKSTSIPAWADDTFEID